MRVASNRSNPLVSAAVLVALGLGGCGRHDAPVRATAPEDPDLAGLRQALADLDDPHGRVVATWRDASAEPLDELLDELASGSLTETERLRLEVVDRPLREAVADAELAHARAELEATIARVRAGATHPRSDASPAPEDTADRHVVLVGDTRFVVLERARDEAWWLTRETADQRRAERRQRDAAFLDAIHKRAR